MDGAKKPTLLAVKIAVAVAAILLLCVVALYLYMSRLDLNSYKGQVQQLLQEQTGYLLRIDGDLTVTPSLHPALRVEGLQLVRGSGDHRLLSVAQLDIQLSLLPLLEGELEISKLTMIQPVVVIEPLRDGRSNWSLDGASAAAASPDEEDEPFLLPEMNRVIIRDAQILYRASGGRVQRLRFPSIQITQRDLRAPLHIKADGKWRQLIFSLEGSLADPLALMRQRASRWEAKVRAAGVKADLNGEILPANGDGFAMQLRLRAEPLSRLLAAIGQGALPKGLVDAPLALQTSLRYAGEQLHLSDLRVALGSSDLQGRIDVDLRRKQPSIKAALSSARLDLAAWLPPDAAAQATTADAGSGRNGAGGGKLLPATPIALPSLNGVNLSLDYRADLLQLPGYAITHGRSRIQIKGGAVTWRLQQAAIAGGKVDATLSLQPNLRPPRVGLNLKATNIMPAQLLAAADRALIERAPMDVTLQWQGRGESIASLLGSGRGELLIQIGKGRIHSSLARLFGGDLVMNLVHVLNPFSDDIDYSELQCGVIHFGIRRGVMRSDHGIAFESTRLDLVSGGSVNLGSEEIDLSIRTRTREGLGINVANMVNVVKLGGTLADPHLEVDAVKTGMAAARVAGAFASGGLSLLGENLLNRLFADDTPCQTALKMKVQ